MKTRSRCIVIAALLCGFATALARQNVPEPSGQALAPDEALRRLDEIQESADEIVSTRTAYTEEERRAYNQWVVAYTQQAYAWHYRSTVLIFVMVVLVVVSGVALAAWQLQAWIARVKAYDAVFLQRLRRGEAVDGQTVASIGEAPGSEVSLKSDALSLSSPYVGVVILALSMGFFMAYLLFVYPVMRGP